MKGAIYNGVQDVKLHEWPMPTCGPKDVIIQNKRAGICGTDIHAYTIEGDSVGIMPGNQFGHEMVGEVYEVGAEVSGVEKGMRVFVDPNKRMPLGKGLNATEIADMAGAFSEFVLVEEAEMGYNLFELPEGLSYDKAVLTEPLAVAMHGVNIANPSAGQKAIIYGGGIIGLAAIAALQSKGITEIIVTDIVPSRLAMARELGAIPFNGREGNVSEFAMETWGADTDAMGLKTTKADIVIDCGGYAGVMEDFIAHAKSGSQLSVVALSGTPEKVVPYMLVAKEINLLGSRGYQAPDILQVLETLNRPECKLDKIITDQFPLTSIEEAFIVASDKEKQIKVIVNHEG
ncbi:MAG: zinc-binding dehydrogenase [Tissierellia bacterium]|nr:zinc-binding dehydrogenase [Tissierellia bacterium]